MDPDVRRVTHGRGQDDLGTDGVYRRDPRARHRWRRPSAGPPTVFIMNTVGEGIHGHQRL